MEYKKLTEKEREDLKSRHKVERDKRVCDRIKAVLMYDNGYRLEEIAKVLLLSHEGIRKHLIDQHGQAKLEPENGGNYSKLTAKQEKAKKSLKRQFKLTCSREIARRNYKDNTLFFERNSLHQTDPRHVDELKWERRHKEDYLIEKAGSFCRK